MPIFINRICNSLLF